MQLEHHESSLRFSPPWAIGHYRDIFWYSNPWTFANWGQNYKIPTLWGNLGLHCSSGFIKKHEISRSSGWECDFLSGIRQGTPPRYLIAHYELQKRTKMINMQVVHRVPTGLVDRLALYTVKVMRTGFDVLSGYKLKNWRGTLSEKCVQNRYRTAVPCRSSPYFRQGSA